MSYTREQFLKFAYPGEELEAAGLPTAGWYLARDLPWGGYATWADWIASLGGVLTTAPNALASLADINIWEVLDWLVPEELVGLDITPGQVAGTDPGFLGIGKVPTGRVMYDNVWVEDGKIKTMRKGTLRVLGYTPREAKKRFRTRRRRKRLTKRDMYILEVIKETGKTGLLTML